MIASLQCTVIDCPDPTALARFYAAILGVEVDDSDPDWLRVAAPGGQGLAFQRAPELRSPRWPDPEYPQQMHLDFDVPSLANMDRAHADVIALGATFLHDSGADTKGFRVYADPAGHPFCLCWGQL